MGEISLADALREYLRHSPFRHQMHEYRVQALWENQMGKTISRYTDSIRLRGSTLIISTSVAALKQELSYSREQIRERLNEALGEKVIEQVVIK